MKADRKFLCSIAIVVGIAVSQCGSTQYSKSTQVDYGDSIDSPLFMTWAGTLWNVVLVLPSLASRASAGEPALLRKALLGGSLGLSAPGFLLRVLFFYAAWLVANYSYQRALRYTTASLVAALFSATPAFVAVGSTVLLSRPLASSGWFAVACTVVGSALVAEPWKQSGGEHASLATGVLFALTAALAAALYKVVFKVVFDEPPPDVVGVILAWIGAYAASVGTAVLLVVLATGAEVVHWGQVPWGPLLASNTLSLAFNFLIGWGIAVSYPLFISMGTVLNVPLNIFCDHAFRGVWPTVPQAAGIALILGGFVLLLRCDLLERSARSAAEEEAAATRRFRACSAEEEGTPLGAPAASSTGVC